MADYAYNPEIEQWRHVPNWEGKYLVSDHGRIFSLPRTIMRNRAGVIHAVWRSGKFLKAYKKNGYPAVGLKSEGLLEKLYIHRLVCEAFNGPCPLGHEVAHNDGNRLNSHANNLRWATRKENMADKRYHGTSLGRDRHPRSKISSDDLAKIFAMFESGSRNADVFRAYPISRAHASNLRKLYKKVA